MPITPDEHRVLERLAQAAEAAVDLHGMNLLAFRKQIRDLQDEVLALNARREARHATPAPRILKVFHELES